MAEQKLNARLEEVQNPPWKDRFFKMMQGIGGATLAEQLVLIGRLASQNPIPPSILGHGAVVIVAVILIRTYSKDKPKNDVQHQSVIGKKVSKFSAWVRKHRRLFVLAIALAANANRLLGMYTLTQKDPEASLRAHALTAVVSFLAAGAVYIVDRPSKAPSPRREP